MDKLKERINRFMEASNTLKEALQEFKTLPPDHPHFKMIRDSVIQRFEYSFDTFWKLLSEYIELYYGVAAPSSPKRSIKVAAEINFITPSELDILFTMVEDRNLTTHTYNELLAEEISKRIPQYFASMVAAVTRMNS